MVWLHEIKYREKAELCYMDTDSFIVYTKTEYICSESEIDVQAKFDTSNYELDRPFPKRKKMESGLMKERLDGKINKESAALRAKIYSYLTDNMDEDKKSKSAKKWNVKRKHKFKDYKHCLEATK